MTPRARAGQANAYRDVGVVGSVSDADPLKLILLTMDGALEAIARARGYLDRGEIPAKAEALSRAVAIVDGLRAFLDHEQGGDVAASLEQLYDYMTRRLTLANAANDAAPLDEVASLLKGIREAWAAVPRQLDAARAEAGA